MTGEDAEVTPVEDTGTAIVDAGGDAARIDVDAGTRIDCNSDPQEFPSFDRSCDFFFDCRIMFHQLDCCGSMHVTAVTDDEREAFLEAENTCRAQLPDCECRALPTIADDGTTGDFPIVDCIDGLCVSTFNAGLMP